METLRTLAELNALTFDILPIKWKTAHAQGYHYSLTFDIDDKPFTIFYNGPKSNQAIGFAFNLFPIYHLSYISIDRHNVLELLRAVAIKDTYYIERIIAEQALVRLQHGLENAYKGELNMKRLGHGSRFKLRPFYLLENN